MDSERRLADAIGVDLRIEKIRIGEHLINYVTAGAGQPVLLIHGGNIGWGQWYLNIPALAKHFKVYAIDLPGGGRSSPIDFKYLNPERDFVDVVRQFIEFHDLSNLHIIGSSVGGWIALRLAKTDKGRINKLVLSNSVGFTNYMRFSDRVISFRLVANFLARTILHPSPQNKNIEKFIRSVFYNKNFRFSKEFIDYFYETTQRTHNILLISKMAELVRKDKYFDLSKDLPKLSNRVLLIWGANDELIPIERCLDSIKKIGNCKLEIIEEAGHIVSIEKFEEFNKLLINYL